MYLKNLVPLLPALEQHTLFQSDARTIILNGNTGTRFTISKDYTELLLDGEPCSRTLDKAGYLWVTDVNAHNSNIIITVDA
nr:MAG TPA: hypothetical protein [Caudoviricetes sp.]